MGFTGGGTTDEIYQKAQEFGLELCPAEVGPQYLLTYTQQPMNEYVTITMKQISDPDGGPCVFLLFRDGSGVRLGVNWAKPKNRWHPEGEFVFRLRK